MKLVKSYAKKAHKHISRKAKAASKLARSVASAATEKVTAFATRKVLLSLATLAFSILPAHFGVKQYHSKMYTKGCIDGAALGIANILPFAAEQIIKNREQEFGKICAEMGQNHAEGKTLEDLLQK